MSKWVYITGAAGLSAIAFWFGSGLHPLWWLVWFAPLPVLLVAPSAGARLTFGASVLAWFIGSLNIWTYFHRLAIPVPVVLTFLAIPSVVFGLSVVLYRQFLKRGSLWRAALVMPLLWVAYEFLAASRSPHSTFFNLGYTQMDCLPLLQIVSITGIWGISFCLFLLPATVAALASEAGNSGERKRVAAAVGTGLIAVMAYGWWRLHFTPAAEQLVTVALVASDSYPGSGEAASKLLRDYAEQVDTMAAKGARLVVLPEKIAIVSDEGTAEWDDVFAASAARGHSTVVVGIDRGSATRRWNEARVYSPAGRLEGLYEKHHMIPGFEDVDQVGTNLLTMNRPVGSWGVQICKDMDFPALSRQYGAEQIDLLIVPAWDFVLDGWLHGRMAVMRGVESGFTIVRSAKQGLLTVSDDRGRILAEQSSSQASISVLEATAPMRRTVTPYVRFGDWFAWLDVAGLLIILVPRKRRAARGGS